MSKKEFAEKLRQLSPKLYATGDIPSEQTIYRYLNGSRELKIELIPYIAEILEINEQELFTFDIEYAANYNRKYSKEIREIVDLLPHAPNSGTDGLGTKIAYRVTWNVKNVNQIVL